MKTTYRYYLVLELPAGDRTPGKAAETGVTGGLSIFTLPLLPVQMYSQLDINAIIYYTGI